MRPERNCLTTSKATLADQDRNIRSALLLKLLTLYPAQLTLTEIIQEMVRNPDDFGERDGIERAVGDLAAAGLLHRHGLFVVPSRAAVCASALLEMP